jgi:hypothetical protein
MAFDPNNLTCFEDIVRFPLKLNRNFGMLDLVDVEFNRIQTRHLD